MYFFFFLLFLSRQRTRNNCTNLLVVGRVVKGTDALSLSLALFSAARHDGGGYHINSSVARPSSLPTPSRAHRNPLTTAVTVHAHRRTVYVQYGILLRVWCVCVCICVRVRALCSTGYGRVLSSRFYRYRPG